MDGVAKNPSHLSLYNVNYPNYAEMEKQRSLHIRGGGRGTAAKYAGDGGAMRFTQQGRDGERQQNGDKSLNWTTGITNKINYPSTYLLS